MVDSLLGWACGSRGTIVRTWDGGHSWHTCATPVDTTLFDIEFSDREHGMACGPGSVLITTDGTTWRRVNPMTSGIGVEQPDTVFRPLRNPMESPPQFVLAGPHSQFQIDVLDVAGRAVAVLGGYQTPAARLITCPTPLTSGIYFAVLQAAGSTAVRKFTLTGRRLTP
jgi:hypothetical protein